MLYDVALLVALLPAALQLFVQVGSSHPSEGAGSTAATAISRQPRAASAVARDAIVLLEEARILVCEGEMLLAHVESDRTLADVAALTRFPVADLPSLSSTFSRTRKLYPIVARASSSLAVIYRRILDALIVIEVSVQQIQSSSTGNRKDRERRAALDRIAPLPQLIKVLPVATARARDERFVDAPALHFWNRSDAPANVLADAAGRLRVQVDIDMGLLDAIAARNDFVVANLAACFSYAKLAVKAVPKRHAAVGPSFLRLATAIGKDGKAVDLSCRLAFETIKDARTRLLEARIKLEQIHRILIDSIIDDLIADHSATAQASKGKCARKKKKKKMIRQRSGAPNVDRGDGPSTVADDEPPCALADSACDAFDHEDRPCAQPGAESSAEAVLVGATQRDARESSTTRAMLPDVPVPATCNGTDDDVASTGSGIPSSTPKSTASNVTVATDVPSTEADDPQLPRFSHDVVVSDAAVLGTRNVHPVSLGRSVGSLWYPQGRVATPEATGIISAQRQSQDMQLAVDLDDFVASAKVAREYDARYRQWALHRVTGAIKTMFPMADVLEVGSAPVGLHLAAPISDVDVVVANVSDAGAGLVRLYEHLKRDPAFCDVVHIARASTPVVKMTLSGTTLSVDVAWNAPFVAESRAFVLASSRQHRMFAPLVMYLKYYLFMHGLGTPYYGGVGSFLLYVLVQSHLQVNGEACSASTGTCLRSFFAYYGYEFDAFHQCISVAHGGRIFSKSERAHRGSSSEPWALCVENPFDAAVDVGRSAFNFDAAVRRAFYWTSVRLSNDWQARLAQLTPARPLRPDVAVPARWPGAGTCPTLNN